MKTDCCMMKREVKEKRKRKDANTKTVVKSGAAIVTSNVAIRATMWHKYDTVTMQQAIDIVALNVYVLVPFGTK